MSHRIRGTAHLALGLLLAAPVLAPSAAAAPPADGGVVWTAAYETLDRTVLSCEVREFDLLPVALEGKTYTAVSLDGAGVAMMDRAGHPQLPVLARSLMIPDQARMEIRVLRSRFREIPIEHGVVPHRGPISRAVDPATVPFVFGEEYERDAWFPEAPAALRAPYILRDVRGVTVEVFPFQYHPKKKLLRIYEEIEVAVESAGPGSINCLDRAGAPDRRDPSFEAVYMNQFINCGGNRTEPPAEYGDMLVICHGPFMDAMKPFLDWKNAIGINTTIIDVAEIGNDPDSIKSHINALYEKTDLAYVLLVGDHKEVRSGVVGGLSDPYYSTLTADWYPDVFVGRFSAETAAQVETQVKRTIEYEQAGHDVSMGGWNAKAMGIASAEGAGAGHYGEADKEHAALMRLELLAYGFLEVDRIYDPNASKSKVSQGLNAGRRVVNYTGHGSTTSWGTTGFSNSDVNALKNAGMLPFINSVACVNGAFMADCFAEAWMRATHNGEPAGAVACYMSSINQSWAPPMYAQGNHAAGSQLGAMERFWMEAHFSVCGLWFGGSCIMMDICGAAGRSMFMTWICFGDPSLRINGVPEPETLSADGWAVPVNAAADIHFTVKPGAAHAGDQYFLLAGASGTSPGTPLPGGILLPLNFDALTAFVLGNPGSPVFQQFHGTLNGAGEALATFSTNGAIPLDPAFVGTALYFSAVVRPSNQGYELATNPKILMVVDG